MYVCTYRVYVYILKFHICERFMYYSVLFVIFLYKKFLFFMLYIISTDR